MSTTKVKTSELTGNAMCYTLCVIEMPHLVWGETIGIHEYSDQIVVLEMSEPRCYSPFMNWAMFGPIIEREQIATWPEAHAGAIGTEASTRWYGRIYYNGGEQYDLEQPAVTPLIAAMRCFIASRLGDDVKIPDELM